MADLLDRDEALKFYGPFIIIERIGAAAYKLQLPESAKIHPIFHVSLLKKAIGNAPVETSLPHGFDTDPTNITHLVKCLATRTYSRNGVLTPQWLIQWPNNDEATWEDAIDIQT
ncbi:uncharacterized protein [Rutidosis leptorrhynchoides]|uniref:uncharacterized protein n=1 Tax=Rutidosis leptorrhynchoides TaxID=125765 RepID=UPI003A9A2B61